MTIYGVALLAICALAGILLGDLLGMALQVKSNVGGVGLAMVLLIAARIWLDRKGKLSHGLKLGVEFWGSLYIPIVVAMAAQQNVVGAVSGGPIVVIAAILTVALCLGSVALLGRIGPRTPALPPPDHNHAEQVLSGDPG
jgi:malonate transporter MadL subunit